MTGTEPQASACEESTEPDALRTLKHAAQPDRRGDPRWQFYIDVGGTFTDIIARTPDAQVLTFKLLSTGAVRGMAESRARTAAQTRAESGTIPTCLVDTDRVGEPDGLWTGYQCTLFHPDGSNPRTVTVTHFDGATGCLTFSGPQSQSGAPSRAKPIPDALPPRLSYELRSDEEAPIVGIRKLMGLPLAEPIGPIDVRLGTTRGTNALLERKGAKVAFVTTSGFADVLKIGYQDRPRLFDLNIRKREELAVCSIEVEERVSANGEVLVAPDRDRIRSQLCEARASGIDAIAICLLHAHINAAHETIVAEIAESVGFAHVSVSSRVAPLEGIVPRGDTTVVDAYLGAVIEDYVASLRRSMPEATLRLMTSNGGLVSADAISGKDTILSGPAGGVVGCAHVTQRAGFDKAIGFDMGGTSTDVSRVAAAPAVAGTNPALADPKRHRFEYQHETVKAGVRIVTPMLAVETVAAGGGSVCSFDGQKLTVGPQSAGADPGPACYGRGGPLTVTDVNVFLGRVVPEHFPFHLDRRALEDRLSAIADAVADAATRSTKSTVPNAPARGSRMTPLELATGYVRIANDKMASAIKRISIAKGIDVRDHVLCSFGGAGGQHACAIARLLGISRVLLNPYAGVLSALGIGVSAIKRVKQHAVAAVLRRQQASTHPQGGPAGDEAVLRMLGPTIQKLTEQVRAELAQEGIPASAMNQPEVSLDLCYQGQDSLITIPVMEGTDPTVEFEQAHHKLYGYIHEGRPIEARVVRVEQETKLASGELTDAGASLIPPCSDDRRTVLPDRSVLATQQQTDMVIDGQRLRVPVYVRGDLRAGHCFEGPAIVVEETSTVVIDPGWRADVTHIGDVIATDLAANQQHEVAKPQSADEGIEANAVDLELFNNRFSAIAEQMGVTLRRTALSTNVKQRLDYSCAVFTPTGDLVVNAPHIPVHLGAMSQCVKSLIADVGEFHQDDVYITNDPFRGGSHLNDVTVVTPVHDEAASKILFFVASRAHHAEIGGKQPGSMPPDSTNLAEEGVVIRAFRWIEHGQAQAQRLRDLLTSPPYPSRAPDDNLADIAAQVAANRTGARDLAALMRFHGVEVVHAYMGHIQTAAEMKMRDALERLPDGEHRFEDRLDDGTTIRVAITIVNDPRSRTGVQATIDFSGTSGVHAGNLNANEAIVSSAVLYCLRCLMNEDIPLNAGVLAPVRIVLPECFLNVQAGYDAEHSPAVVGGNVETSQRIVDCIFGALATVAASQGTMNNVLLGDDSFGYYETICGGAGAGPTPAIAGSGFPGADAVHTHMTNTRLTDAEVLESRYPLRLHRFVIRRGSGGEGRFQGGDGVVREIEALRPLELSILSQRRTCAPYGLAGGQAGKCGRNWIVKASSDERIELAPIAHASLRAGDRVIIETPGGGGYGAPDLTEPHAGAPARADRTASFTDCTMDHRT